MDQNLICRNTIPLTPIREIDFDHNSRKIKKDLLTFRLVHHTLEMKGLLLSEYTDSDIIKFLNSGEGEELILRYNNNDINYLNWKILKSRSVGHIKCSDSFISFCIMNCIFNRIILINDSLVKNRFRKQKDFQFKLNFDLDDRIYSMLNKSNFQSAANFVMVSENKESLTDLLGGMFIMFNHKKLNWVTKHQISDSYDKDAKYHYLLMPVIIYQGEYPHIPVINEFQGVLKVLEMAIFVDSEKFGPRLFIEMLIDSNKFQKLEILYINLIYRIKKYPLYKLRALLQNLTEYFKNRYTFRIIFRVGLAHPISFNPERSNYRLTDYKFIPCYLELKEEISKNVKMCLLFCKAKSPVLSKLHNYVVSYIFKYFSKVKFHNFKRKINFY